VGRRNSRIEKAMTLFFKELIIVHRIMLHGNSVFLLTHAFRKRSHPGFLKLDYIISEDGCLLGCCTM
jgi:hypothetical protein